LAWNYGGLDAIPDYKNNPAKAYTDPPASVPLPTTFNNVKFVDVIELIPFSMTVADVIKNETN